LRASPVAGADRPHSRQTTTLPAPMPAAP
jgi:hypothetical protein